VSARIEAVTSDAFARALAGDAVDFAAFCARRAAQGGRRLALLGEFATRDPL
jgi:hypothetical protein